MVSFFFACVVGVLIAPVFQESISATRNNGHTQNARQHSTAKVMGASVSVHYPKP